MKIAISADSACDLNKELLTKNNVSTLPFGITLGDKVCRDDEIAPQEIFDFVKKTKILPKTSAINESQYTEYFKNLLKTHDGIVHFCLSGGLSAAYGQAVLAAKGFKNVYVIDSQNLSTGIGLLVLNACKLIKENKNITAEEVYKKSLERVPFIKVYFVIERLDYLYKGGRCSVLQLFGANLFKIKPQIVVKDGKMLVGRKYHGKMEHVVEQNCADALAENKNLDLDTAFITHAAATPEMIGAAKAALKNAGFKNIYVTDASSVISSHCGEHTLGILFMKK